jgi:hypothetical protein
VHPRGAETVPAGRFGDQPDPLDRQRGDGLGQDVERNPGIDERAEQHVARGARGEVEPTDRHRMIMPQPREGPLWP